MDAQASIDHASGERATTHVRRFPEDSNATIDWSTTDFRNKVTPFLPMRHAFRH